MNRETYTCPHCRDCEGEAEYEARQRRRKAALAHERRIGWLWVAAAAPFLWIVISRLMGS